MRSVFPELMFGCSRLLEFLVLIDDLYPMLILLLCRLLAQVCKVAIDRHDGRCRGVPSVGRRSAR